MKCELTSGYIKQHLLTMVFVVLSVSLQANKLDSLKALIPGATQKSLPELQAKVAGAYFTTRQYDSVRYYALRVIENKNADSETTVKAYSHMAKYFIYQNNFDSCIIYGKRGLSTDIIQNSDYAMLLTLTGVAYYYKGELSEAENFYLQALELYTSLNNQNSIASINVNLGIIYKARGDLAKAAEVYQSALRIHEKSTDTVAMANILSNMGNIFHSLDQGLQKSLDFYQQAIELYKKLGDSANYANILNSIGTVYLDQGNYKHAIANYDISRSIFERIKNAPGLASNYDHTGIAYFRTGNYTEALKYFDMATDIYHKLGDTRSIIVQSINLGKVYTKLNKPYRAIKYLNKSIEGAKDKDLLSELMEAHKALSEAYELIPNYKQSLDAYKSFANYRDSLINQDNIKIIEELQTKYETEKKEQQLIISEAKNQVLELRNKRNKIIMFTIGPGFITILLFSLVLYRQVRLKQRANKKLEEQRDQILQQSKEIQDSINYASFIQRAILPPDDIFTRRFTDYFIFFKPKDVVSGDFYWMHEIDNKVVLVVADCTGHGVPGAFMSMLGMSSLNDIVKKHVHDLTASRILDDLRDKVIVQLHQENDDSIAKDGMDLSLCIFDFDNNKMQISGAFNPVYVFTSNGELEIIKGDRMPIGIGPLKKPFTNHELNLQKGDVMYFFSDGYPDQFGGEHHKKFRIKPFRELITRIKDMPMSEQYKQLNTALNQWMSAGDEPVRQIDDISVIGVKI